jgi:hypothetical protein
LARINVGGEDAFTAVLLAVVFPFVAAEVDVDNKVVLPVESVVTPAPAPGIASKVPALKNAVVIAGVTVPLNKTGNPENPFPTAVKSRPAPTLIPASPLAAVASSTNVLEFRNKFVVPVPRFEMEMPTGSWIAVLSSIIA